MARILIYLTLSTSLMPSQQIQEKVGNSNISKQYFIQRATLTNNSNFNLRNVSKENWINKKIVYNISDNKKSNIQPGLKPYEMKTFSDQIDIFYNRSNQEEIVLDAGNNSVVSKRTRGQLLYDSIKTTLSMPTETKSVHNELTPRIVLKSKLDNSVNNSISNNLHIGNDGYLEDTYPIIINTTLSEINNFPVSLINDYDMKLLNSALRELVQLRNDNKSQAVGNNGSDVTENTHTLGYNNITEVFKCNVTQIEGSNITISCTNLNLYELVKYLPNETITLIISNSPTPQLLKPLFPQLKNLKKLKLHNNNHRYITNAFKGLENLESLDLSHNKIVVINKAFQYLPNLKCLNLTRNEIHRVGTIVKAVNGLQYLEHLVLNHNWRIKRIVKDEFKSLINSKLQKLELFNTTMSVVEKGAFDHLPHLRLLDLSVNYLNSQAMMNLISSLKDYPLEFLFLREWVLLTAIPVEALELLKNTSIIRLDLSYNYFPSVKKFPPILSLKSLWLMNSDINYIDHDAFSALPKLETLVLSGNNMGYNLYNFSLGNLKTLILSDQKIRYNKISFEVKEFAFNSMTNLEILDLSVNLLGDRIKRYVFYGLRNLKNLMLNSIGISYIADFSFETLNSLHSLNLQSNQIRYLSNFTFFGLNNLTDLYLSANLLTFSENIYPFHTLPLLENILLMINKIEYIPEYFFSSSKHLDYLILSRNKILPWHKRIFHENATITTLDLFQNQIDYITPVMLEEFHQVTENIDISRNPFNCTKCGMFDFQQFLRSSHLNLGLPRHIKYENGSISCLTPKTLQNQSFLEVEIPVSHCLEEDGRIFPAKSVFFILFASLSFSLTVSACYSFRWYIRYWIFHIKATVKERKNSFGQSEKQYKYDAFVSYNSNDTPWIISYLIPALEQTEPELKLCIHERDFQVGQLITENILEAIENSRKVILILTEDFVRSEWCMFELHIAQHRLFDETRDCLLLIKLKSINKKYYTKNLSYLEKTRNCFIWPDDLESQKLFWNKIRKVLGFSKDKN